MTTQQAKETRDAFIKHSRYQDKGSHMQRWMIQRARHYHRIAMGRTA